MSSPATAARSAAAAWRIVGASVQGTGHKRAGMPCQDAHGHAVLSGGAVALAAADGAGSAAHAERGSAAAVRAALGHLSAAGEVPDDDEALRRLLRGALDAAREALGALAASLPADPREVATTLIVAVLHGSRVAAAQVGDGACVAEDEAGALAALTLPPPSEFANETVFLTTPGVVSEAPAVVWDRPARRVALFTDGLQGLALKLPAGVPHAPFFAPLFRFAADAGDGTGAGEALAAFLSGPKVTARADDDLTLVLAARTTSAGEGG